MHKRKILDRINTGMVILLVAICISTGFSMYRIFMSYVPGSDLNQLFLSRLSVSAFDFFVVISTLLIAAPIILLAFQLFSLFSGSYIRQSTQKGVFFIGEEALHETVIACAQNQPNVENAEARIELYSKARIGIHLWLELAIGTDYAQFAAEMESKIAERLESDFGILNIRYINIYLDTVSAANTKTNIKIRYK